MFSQHVVVMGFWAQDEADSVTAIQKTAQCATDCVRDKDTEILCLLMRRKHINPDGISCSCGVIAMHAWSSERTIAFFHGVASFTASFSCCQAATKENVAEFLMPNTDVFTATTYTH
jgi:phenylpropionate dioxygenase-like ring-hydroxylating dioxygenase large terminal subunit